jgi:hypothetical protein
MIRLIDMKARLECDHEGCTASVSVSIVLLPTGGVAPKVPGEIVGHWQLFADKQQPMKPYSGLCPKHAQKESRVQLAGSSTLILQ